MEQSIFYYIYIVLILSVFLLALNKFLRGEWKAKIGIFLTALVVGLIIATFFIGNWQFGLFALGLAFISFIICRPIAARLASKLFTKSIGSRGKYVGLPPRRLKKISKELGRPLDLRKANILNNGDRRDSAKEALLDFCYQQPRISALLGESQISRKALQALYDELIMAGAGQWICGHWVAASAIAYPESLQYMLKKNKNNIQETAFNLIMYFEQGTPLKT